MEPRIQYAMTVDGVSIAFWTIGEGDPIVDMGTPPFSHIRMEWQMPEIRRWYERFAARHLFVRLDTRGTGLSDRDLSSYSVGDLALDLEAVVDRLGLDRFTLLGAINSGLPAISYAARHPNRIAKLILWCAYARGSDFFGDPGTEALRTVVDMDWSMFTETAAQSRFGWTEGDFAHRYAQLIRAAVTPNVQRTLMDTFREADVTPLLADVTAPTLVMQREDRGAAVARRIASLISDARVVMFEGGSAAPYLHDADAIWDAIAEFIGDVPAAPLSRERASAGGVVTILFTDVEGSTALTQRLGDAKARELLREHERVVRECLKAHGGSEVKTMGDGFMASFASAARALECAVAIQRAFAERGSEVGAHGHAPLRVRIGLNAGEPIAEEDPEGRGDLFGATVQLASRICDCAQPGAILVSNAIRELSLGKGFLFRDMGEVELKGFEQPVRLHEVRWQTERT